MTRRSYALDTIEPEAFVCIHPEDAERLGLDDGDFARVSSRRGEIELEVRHSHRESAAARASSPSTSARRRRTC